MRSRRDDDGGVFLDGGPFLRERPAVSFAEERRFSGRDFENREIMLIFAVLSGRTGNVERFGLLATTIKNR